MSDVLSCCPPCNRIEVINTPGSEGQSGSDGQNGINAFTKFTGDTAQWTMDGDTVACTVENATWMVIGQILIAGVSWDGLGNGPAHFQVASFGSSISVNLTKLTAGAYPGDLVCPFNIDSGSTLTPSA